MKQTFVVGTGRCGTGSIAVAYHQAGVHAGHETALHVIPQICNAWVCGRYDLWQTASLLEQIRFPTVEASYLLSELIGPLRLAFPDARFVWVSRNREDTVRSMVRKGWYDPADDMLWPVGVEWWHRSETNGGAAKTVWPVQAAQRTTPPLVGEGTWRVWREVPQADRCRWWWDYCQELIGVSLAGSDFVEVDVDRDSHVDGLPIPHVRH